MIIMIHTGGYNGYNNYNDYNKRGLSYRKALCTQQEGFAFGAPLLETGSVHIVIILSRSSLTSDIVLWPVRRSMNILREFRVFIPWACLFPYG